MANKRQAKKNKRRALENKARQYGIEQKELKTQSLKSIEIIVTYEEKKEKQRKTYADKKKKIEDAGLAGYMSPGTSLKNWDKEWKKAQRKKRVHDKRETLLNAEGINKDKVKNLSDSKIDAFTWQQVKDPKNGASALFDDVVDPLEGKDRKDKVYTVDTGIYIGFFSNDGSMGVGYMLSSYDFYSGYSVEQLQSIMEDVITQKGVGGSTGKAGDVIILVDNTPGTRAMIEGYRALEYHDIILPDQKKFTPKAVLALTCAVIEFSREDNRRQIYNDLKEYFTEYGKGLGDFFP